MLGGWHGIQVCGGVSGAHLPSYLLLHRGLQDLSQLTELETSGFPNPLTNHAKHLGHPLPHDFSKPLSSGSTENFWILSHSSCGGSFSGSLSGSKRIYCPLMLQPHGMFMRGTTLLGSGGVSDSHITNHLGPVIQTFLLHAGRASKTRSPKMHLPSEITLHSDSVLSRPMTTGIFISSLWVRPVLGKLRLHAINWC